MSNSSTHGQTTPRPSWDEYFIQILDATAARSTCDRGRSGAVLVDGNNQLRTTGYVGAPAGFPHCDDIGHLWSQTTPRHCIRTIHAEQNAIVAAARCGAQVYGGTLYCTMEPCYTCAMMVIGLGIHRVIAKHPYHGAKRTREAFHFAGIHLETLSTEPLYVP